jgi:hypothetical protein
MRALKAKRDAATEQLKQAQADPAHTDRAQKLSDYYMAERDLWSTRVIQVMERLRKLVPDPKDQEALSIMRDFTHGLPFELPAWLNGTHPVLEDLDPEQHEAVMKNIERLRPAIERAQNPTPRMIQANDVLTQIAEASGKEAVQRGMIEKGLDPQRYFSHLLNPKGEGEIPTSLAERIGKALGGKIGRKYAFSAHRVCPCNAASLQPHKVRNTDKCPRAERRYNQLSQWTRVISLSCFMASRPPGLWWCCISSISHGESRRSGRS